MRRADQADSPLVALVLQPGEPLLPVHEVVDLHQLDVPAEEAQLLGEAGLGGGLRARPGLGGEERALAPGGERAAQHLLGAAVHGRRVEHGGAGLEGRAHHLVRERLFPL